MLYGSMAWLFTERARQKKAGDIKAFYKILYEIKSTLSSKWLYCPLQKKKFIVNTEKEIV